jgi:hypothetical protein
VAEGRSNIPSRSCRDDSCAGICFFSINVAASSLLLFLALQKLASESQLRVLFFSS